MRIRLAHADDAKAICAISNALIRDSLITFTTDLRSEAATREAIGAAGGSFLVAEEDGSVVGFASFGPFRGGPGYAHTKEHSIQLAPQARGRGVGKNLMARLEDIAVEHDVHALIAGISSANPAGVAFHKAPGFTEVGRMPEVGRKFGQWLDLILMQKIL